MCGIAGIVSIKNHPLEQVGKTLQVMSSLMSHRGPDGQGIWQNGSNRAGFAHRRLSVIDLVNSTQPMVLGEGNRALCLVFNGEIYNYRELRNELGSENFFTTGDTETILKVYQKWGQDCLTKLRGMFSFALWDEKNQSLFCARDRFGIKPFYYTVQDGVFYFASEVKCLLPFLPSIEICKPAFADYLAFQLPLSNQTMFQGVFQLPPGHYLKICSGQIHVHKYWDVYYNLDTDHNEQYFERVLAEKLEESVRLHCRADVPIGAYVSGGLDSSLVASIGKEVNPGLDMAFIGKFSEFGSNFDESRYAERVTESLNIGLHQVDITAKDFISSFEKLIYHLDYPAAGPGAFAQYAVSGLAGKHRKVVLGGQGGDEIFGGYARYLVAYFEQCIKAAIEGTMNNGNFIVTYESIIPNLKSLKQYKPMLQEFWREDLFAPMDRRYFRLVNRSTSFGSEIRWDALGDYSPFEAFNQIYSAPNISGESYFDRMTHFDFKTLLPALLQIEDRVSMAHGLESRVPFLDHPLVEFAATMPANVKFKNGNLKHILKNAADKFLPHEIVHREDKMGFPVPLNSWIKDEARDFVQDILGSNAALGREYVDGRQVLTQLNSEPQFGRKIWGLLCVEVWFRTFVDRAADFRALVQK